MSNDCTKLIIFFCKIFEDLSPPRNWVSPAELFYLNHVRSCAASASGASSSSSCSSSVADSQPESWCVTFSRIFNFQDLRDDMLHLCVSLIHVCAIILCMLRASRDVLGRRNTFGFAQHMFRFVFVWIFEIGLVSGQQIVPHVANMMFAAVTPTWVTQTVIECAYKLGLFALQESLAPRDEDLATPESLENPVALPLAHPGYLGSLTWLGTILAALLYAFTIYLTIKIVRAVSGLVHVHVTNQGPEINLRLNLEPPHMPNIVRQSGEWIMRISSRPTPPVVAPPVVTHVAPHPIDVLPTLYGAQARWQIWRVAQLDS